MWRVSWRREGDEVKEGKCPVLLRIQWESAGAAQRRARVAMVSFWVIDLDAG